MMISFRHLGWTILHAALTTSVPLFLLLIAGCSPQLKTGGEPEFGPEISATELDKAVDQALEEVDPRDIKKGQTVVLESNLRIFNGPVQPLETTFIQVTGVLETEAALTVTYAKAVDSHIDDSEDRVTEGQIRFPKLIQSLSETPSIAPFLTTHVSKYSASDDSSENENPIERISYHDLEVIRGWSEPPKFVKERANCSNIPDCRLRTSTINYRFVIHLRDGRKLYRVARYVLAPKAPYFAIILERCNSGFVPIDGFNYFVDECEFATDFKGQ